MDPGLYCQLPAAIERHIFLINSQGSLQNAPITVTRDDFPPLTSLGIEYDNTYFVFILGRSIISIRLMIQQSESSTCVSIFIHRCLVSNKKPRMGSFNHPSAVQCAHRLPFPLQLKCLLPCQHLVYFLSSSFSYLFL